MKTTAALCLAAVCAAAALSPAAASDVVTLTEETFDEQVGQTDQPWLIKFYAPWCGHCKRLVPTWEELATATKGEANIAKVDCTQHRNVCSRFGVRGYPTLKLFKDGPNGDNVKYAGQRSLDAFKTYLAKNAPAAAKDLDISVRYFETRGRAEVIRLMLESLGLPYRNRLHARDEWPAIKAAGLADGSLPFGQVPALDYDGRTLVQTNAILRFLAARHRPSAYPNDAARRYAVDVALDGAEDLRKRYGKLVYDPAFSEEKRAAFAAGDLPLWLGHLERLLASAGGASFGGGARPEWTIADLSVYDVITATLGVDAKALDAFPALAAFHKERTAALAAYLRSDRRPAFQNGASASFDNAANPSGFVLDVPEPSPVAAHEDL